jgi:hypothetical protein
MDTPFILYNEKSKPNPLFFIRALGLPDFVLQAGIAPKARQKV